MVHYCSSGHDSQPSTSQLPVARENLTKAVPASCNPCRLMMLWVACMIATPAATAVNLSPPHPASQQRRREAAGPFHCGMQTPGTLILDGGEFDRSPDRATSQAIMTHLPGGITPEQAELALIVAGGATLQDEERDKYLALWTSSDGLRFDPDGFTILHPESENPRHSGIEDAAQADSDDFVKPLETADVVFMRGGRQWRLVDAFKYTRTHEEMWNLLERGGTIAGTSAGTTSQGFFMPRGDPDGAHTLVADRSWHQYGFGFLRGVAVDVHVDGRDRWDDLYEVLREEDPTLLGIGISEYTAIVVQGHYFQVVGDDVLNNLVAVYNCSDKSDCNAVDSPYLMLKPGDWYDLCSREVVSAPPPEKLVVQSARSFVLPYFFEDDYRLAAREYQCSGRHCRWLSSPIDTGEFINLGLSAHLTSRGELEADDYLKVSYRFRVDGVYWGWVDLFSATAGVDVEISANIFVDPEAPQTTLQIRIESATSDEGGEAYMVRSLAVSGLTLRPATPGPATPGPTTFGPTTLGPTTPGPTTPGPTTIEPTTPGPTTLGLTTLEPTTPGPTILGPRTLGPTTDNGSTLQQGSTTTFGLTTDNGYTSKQGSNTDDSRLALIFGVVGMIVVILIVAFVMLKRREKKTTPNPEKTRPLGLKAILSALPVVRVETHPESDSSVWTSDESNADGSVYSKAQSTPSIVQEARHGVGNGIDQRTSILPEARPLERQRGSLFYAVDMEAPHDDISQDAHYAQYGDEGQEVKWIPP